MNIDYVLGKFVAPSLEPAMSFVMALQGIKKSQVTWAGTSLSERLALLKKVLLLLEQEKEKLTEPLASAAGISPAEALSFDIEAGISLISQACQEVSAGDDASLGAPTGLMLLLPPKVLAFRWLCEHFARSLLAGNAMIVRSSMNAVAAEKLARIWDQALEGMENQKSLLSVFHAEAEVGRGMDEMLIAHPGIRAVAAADLSVEEMEKIVHGSAAHLKKLRLMGLGSNSALVLADADLDHAAREIGRSLLAAGATPWAINKIFVLESQAKAFEERLQQYLGQASTVKISTEEEVRLRKLYQQALQENGKHLTGEFPEPLVISDLSHCSTLQQDALRAPILFVLPVKYQHEMIKWANTGYLGLVHFIFGSLEKAQKLAARLESGVIIHNRWLHREFSLRPAEPWPLGVKQSFYGLGDGRVFGEFFSERRIFDI
jgi:aminomuconate-semialdehyde/2-hydroxymuconate-6-semialdehyde dehydrogenase